MKGLKIHYPYGVLSLQGSTDNHLHIFLFRGAVAVSMSLKMLDANQCNAEYHVPNAFKRTHKCDEQTSYVSFTIFLG